MTIVNCKVAIANIGKHKYIKLPQNLKIHIVQEMANLKMQCSFIKLSTDFENCCHRSVSAFLSSIKTKQSRESYLLEAIDDN